MQFAKQLGRENIREGFFGQEINITNIDRINAAQHGRIEEEHFSRLVPYVEIV